MTMREWTQTDGHKIDSWTLRHYTNGAPCFTIDRDGLAFLNIRARISPMADDHFGLGWGTITGDGPFFHEEIGGIYVHADEDANDVAHRLEEHIGKFIDLGKRLETWRATT